MIYSNERPVIEASHARNLDDFKEHMIPIIWRLMKQKSLGWAYEREYRAFVDLGKDCNLSNGMYFRRIPEKSLKRVLLGFKCPLQEKEVREALHSSGLTTTTVARARMCLKSYEILC